MRSSITDSSKFKAHENSTYKLPAITKYCQYCKVAILCMLRIPMSSTRFVLFPHSPSGVHLSYCISNCMMLYYIDNTVLNFYYLNDVHLSGNWSGQIILSLFFSADLWGCNCRGNFSFFLNSCSTYHELNENNHEFIEHFWLPS